MPVISVLRKLKQEDEFGASLGNIVRPCLKKQKETTTYMGTKQFITVKFIRKS
jgi:hypothetical protein